jgi:2C-methyl-D-erythritol 2,4-cyclodiphosphate synthase
MAWVQVKDMIESIMSRIGKCFLKNVLTQVDGDSLCKINRLKKLECFSKERFKDINVDYNLKKKRKKIKKEKDKIEERVIYDDKEIQRDILSIGYKDREGGWIGGERWDMVRDFGNYWGNISIDEKRRGEAFKIT